MTLREFAKETARIVFWLIVIFVVLAVFVFILAHSGVYVF